MKAQYLWKVKAITWEDRQAIQREVKVVAPDIPAVLDQLERMAVEFRDARIESITMENQYFGGVR